MKETKLNVSVEGNELTIREGKAKEVFNPEVVNIQGTLDAPLRWIEKRIDLIDQKACHILVDRDKMQIELVINEKDHFGDSVSGSMVFHPDFIKFGINTGQYRTAFEMAEFIKMNRAFFENRSEAMNLVTQLRQFKAKVDRQVEADHNPNKGDKRVLVQQAVESNIPESFSVIIPIFKGTAKQTLSLETYFNPDDLTCTLVSPEANEIAEDFKDSEIDRVINSIKELAPNIVFIEK